MTINKIKFRKLEHNDKHPLFLIYSDKTAMKYRGSKPMKRIEDAELFIQNQTLEEGIIRTIRQGIESVEEKQLIGTVMYRFNKNNTDACEIGYSIGRAFWRKGFGKEIVKVMLKTIQENKEIHTVIAWSNIENIASIKVLEHNEFQRTEQTEYQNCYLYKKTIRNASN